MNTLRNRLQSQLDNKTINIRKIKEIIYEEERLVNIKYELDLLYKCAQIVFETTKEEINSRNRKPKNSMARQFIAWQLVRQGWKREEVGRVFRRNQSTITAMIRTVDNLIDTKDRRYYELWMEFNSILNFYLII
jgi:chromosomal replication initiation ATPase DnaA